MKFSFVHKDFEDQSILPNKLAVVGEDVELSWLDFEKRVNQLCQFFKDYNLTRSKYPVIVYGHKSANMLVAFYAMMKLEIPYIPIDLVYPRERVEKVIKTANAQVFINTTTTAFGFENGNEIGISSEGVISKTTDLHPIDQVEKTSDPLVYLIFTSGSTGEPKGVQISTEAVQSFVRWMCKDFGFTTEEVFVNTAILSFDLSVFEVMTFGALGGTLLLNNTEVGSDPKKLMPRIKKYQGSTWVSTPSFSLIYSRLGEEEQLSSIKTFLFCGEVLPNPLAKALLRNFPTTKVFNTYGPTEATVATTIVEITPELVAKHSALPVGRSKMESQLLIEEGEIVIVGPNVSMGYLNNPELNKMKFVHRNGERAFRTGDLGYLKDGMLFFNGRNDDLVKLHGYRIELNEITSALNDLPYVAHGEAIALRRNGDVKKIVGLIQMLGELKFDRTEIKKDLERTLPPYMIPSDFKAVDRVPLNQNGKADKKLLQEIYLKK